MAENAKPKQFLNMKLGFEQPESWRPEPKPSKLLLDIKQLYPEVDLRRAFVLSGNLREN